MVQQQAGDVGPLHEGAGPVVSVVADRFDAEHAAGELQVRFHCGVQGLGGFVDRRGRVCPVAVAWRAFAGGGLFVGDLLEGWHAGLQEPCEAFRPVLDAFLAQVRVAGRFAAGRACSLFHHPRPFAGAILACWTMRASAERWGLLLSRSRSRRGGLAGNGLFSTVC